MKKLILSVFLLVNFANADLKYVKEMIGYMQPNKVEYKDNILYIQLLKQDRINYNIIYNIIKTTYCGDLWLNGDKSFLKDFKNINGVVLLNKHAYQSAIYRGKYADCKRIGDIVESKIANMEIASKLVFVTGGSLEKELKLLKSGK